MQPRKILRRKTNNYIVTKTMSNTGMVNMNSDEELYLGTAESEHIEMYLKAIWHMREKNEKVKVSSIAKILNVRQPSVVQMLHKLNSANLVDYEKGNAEMNLTTEGKK